jgi:hypothetical protein
VTDDLRRDIASEILDTWRAAPDDATFGQLADRFAAAVLPLVDAHGRAAAATALRQAADAAHAVFRAGDSDEGETWAKWLRIRAAEAQP